MTYGLIATAPMLLQFVLAIIAVVRRSVTGYSSHVQLFDRA